MNKLILAGAVVLAVAVSGCGRMADLEAPPARKTERAQRDGRGPALPEPATINRPPSQLPIDGATDNNPFGGSGNNPR